ncbi:hypothetical protein ACFQL1_24180 [Halomicroarcula sp. GCM10025709]|uniref:hypothetical protein n=1 Tax=Haloarcula TaxID=2237 RepID=UPI0024C3D5BA|nr:hypothetical protein [Halomicroarcula sp. YJ-61-S]
MSSEGTATLGDFGAGGRRSEAMIDKEQAAIDATVGEWEFQVHTSNSIGWHVPDTTAALLLRSTNQGWALRRAGKLIGSCETLDEGLLLAHKHMQARPEGQR